MRFILIGADFEENLGMCMIKTSLEQAGHQVRVLAFNEADQARQLVASVMATRADAVGLSIQFQHRAQDFLALARQLRAAGFKGHITCGGQFPSMAWQEVLNGRWGVSSIVLYEGEETIVELAAAIVEGKRLQEVAGLALLTDDGVAYRTRSRAMCESLDALPVAHRYRHHTRHLGVAFVPISGSRGCWGGCSFCSISTLYRDARQHGWTRSIRWRSPEGIAAEMGALAHAAGGSAVFCFHDDNFLLPRPADSIERVRGLREALDRHEPGVVGFVGKCRPDSMTPELARELARLGVIRMYVGIENASEAGCKHLNRRTTIAQMGAALDSLAAAGIFTCYNLLVFEPETTLDDVRDNIAFMRSHLRHPVNFCRAEAYHGTPLHLQLRESGRLGGSYLGWDYRIRDDRAELLFRMFAAAFRERNFGAHGVANRHMSIGYCVKLLEHFYEDSSGRRGLIAHKAAEITRDLTLESADFLEQALRLAEQCELGDRERIERETALLGLRIAAADQHWHVVLDKLMAEMEEFTRQAKRPAFLRNTRKAVDLARKLGLAACIGVWGAGCSGKTETSDPLPPPQDGGADVKDSQTEDIFMADCVPPDAGQDIMVVDDVPADAGVDVQQADPPPFDAGVEDVSPFDSWADPVPPDAAEAVLDMDRFHDTAPRRALRTKDLPLFQPPQVRMQASRDGARVVVKLCGHGRGMTTRWQASGEIEGDGGQVVWTPGSPEDQLRVAVRSHGGVAVVSLRAIDIV
ncbi:MAG: radical SAM protein [Deltaproteobacteria bacterium]|nr:radical SAM protein [Deltaproteobacteria bacterium]